MAILQYIPACGTAFRIDATSQLQPILFIEVPDQGIEVLFAVQRA
jgi:hypothetical protein